MQRFQLIQAGLEKVWLSKQVLACEKELLKVQISHNLELLKPHLEG